jgi:hypothetical protein
MWKFSEGEGGGLEMYVLNAVKHAVWIEKFRRNRSAEVAKLGRFIALKHFFY